MHEIVVCVVLRSCIDDWSLARMIVAWLYAYVLFLYIATIMLYMHHVDLLILKKRYPTQAILRYVGLL